jgi:transposase
MAAERLSMRRLREILRLKFEAGLSQKAIAVSANVAQSTVSDYVGRARRAGVGWPLAPEVDDEAALERLLFPTAPEVAAAERPEPDWAWVHRELRRQHVTRMLLWEEYRAGVTDGLAYSQFCNRYRTWAAALPCWRSPRCAEIST